MSHTCPTLCTLPRTHCAQPEGSALHTVAHGGEGAWERWHEEVKEEGRLLKTLASKVTRHAAW